MTTKTDSAINDLDADETGAVIEAENETNEDARDAGTEEGVIEDAESFEHDADAVEAISEEDEGGYEVVADFEDDLGDEDIDGDDIGTGAVDAAAADGADEEDDAGLDDEIHSEEDEDGYEAAAELEDDLPDQDIDEDDVDAEEAAAAADSAHADPEADRHQEETDAAIQAMEAEAEAADEDGAPVKADGAMSADETDGQEDTASQETGGRPELTVIDGTSDEEAGEAVAATAAAAGLDLDPKREFSAPDAIVNNPEHHVRMIEAILFASAEPVSEAELAERLPKEAVVGPLLDELQAIYGSRGVHLVQVAGKWAFRTAPDLGFLLEKERVESRKLSRAAIETLAIIAYHQPVTRAEIEELRGVSVSKGTLDVLLDIGWVGMRGRRPVPGRPVTYGTTPAFLEHFGLAGVGDLPGIEELKAAGLLDSRLPPEFAVPTPITEGLGEGDGDFEEESPELELEAGDDGDSETAVLAEDDADANDEADSGEDLAYGHAAQDDEDLEDVEVGAADDDNDEVYGESDEDFDDESEGDAAILEQIAEAMRRPDPDDEAFEPDNDEADADIAETLSDEDDDGGTSESIDDVARGDETPPDIDGDDEVKARAV